jgi:hypothetical protein
VGQYQPAFHRTIMILDVERFGDPARKNLDQLAVRDGMYRALIQAFEKSEISWSNCMTEDRGDGALILVPPEVPKSLLVSKVPGALVDAVSMHNEACSIQARMRLRMALHAGEIHRDAHGFAGTAINHAFRLVEAPSLKSALGSSPGVLALIVSEWFFEEVVQHDPEADPLSYRKVDVNVKETQAGAWIRLCDDSVAKSVIAGIEQALEPVQSLDKVAGAVAMSLKSATSASALDILVRESIGILLNERGEVSVPRLLRAVAHELPDASPSAISSSLGKLRETGKVSWLGDDIMKAGVIRVHPY